MAACPTLTCTLYQLSPFAHVPNILLGETVGVAPLVALVYLSALLSLVGLMTFVRRDVG